MKEEPRSTDSIEGTFAKLRPHLDKFTLAAEPTPMALEAARALMLAVLDEAFAVPELPGSIYVARRDVDKLRAHIAALGSGGEEA